MPPFPGIPYGEAPAYCFPIMEFCAYILFVLCFMHAMKKGVSHIGYLLGGLVFGLILEYVNVITNMGYTYGEFLVMFGQPPTDIPLCIGVGWGIIMYTARLFTDSFKLPLWSAAAMDVLLAISIDLSMDAVAYRLHAWHWNWTDSGRNPLTADWFGVPFGNFFGWQLVVFFYSSISRLLERAFHGIKENKLLLALVPVIAVLLSQVFLYVMLAHVDVFLKNQFGITSLHRFITFLIILIILTVRGVIKRTAQPSPMPFIAWLVPLWFHLYFYTWLFLGGFYKESHWLVAAATINMLLGVSIHFIHYRKRSTAHTSLIQRYA